MKQKLCNWNGKEVLLVEVMTGVTKFNIFEGKASDFDSKEASFLQFKNPIGFWDWPIKLPHGTYRFAFASPLKPTEAEAGGWVESIGDGMYRNYRNPNAIHDCSMSSAYCNKTRLVSLHSRYRYEGFQHPERTIVLVKDKPVKS